MGRNARQVFELRYSKTIAIKRWQQGLNSVLKGERIGENVFIETGEAAVFDKRTAASV